MSMKLLTNKSENLVRLQFHTGNRLSGNSYVNLKKGEKHLLDSDNYTDQVKRLLKKKVLSEQDATPVLKVVAAPVVAPPVETVTVVEAAPTEPAPEMPALQCDICAELFETEKKLAKHKKNHEQQQ